jgi:hypothetical protein
VSQAEVDVSTECNQTGRDVSQAEVDVSKTGAAIRLSKIPVKQSNRGIDVNQTRVAFGTVMRSKTSRRCCYMLPNILNSNESDCVLNESDSVPNKSNCVLNESNGVSNESACSPISQPDNESACSPISQPDNESACSPISQPDGFTSGLSMIRGIH